LFFRIILNYIFFTLNIQRRACLPLKAAQIYECEFGGIRDLNA